MTVKNKKNLNTKHIIPSRLKTHLQPDKKRNSNKYLTMNEKIGLYKCWHNKQLDDKRILTQQTTGRRSIVSLLSYFGCSSPSTPCSCFLLSFLLWCCLLLFSSTSFQLRSPRSFFSCSSTTAFNDSRTSSSGRYKYTNYLF